MRYYDKLLILNEILQQFIPPTMIYQGYITVCGYKLFTLRVGEPGSENQCKVLYQICPNYLEYKDWIKMDKTKIQIDEEAYRDLSVKCSEQLMLRSPKLCEQFFGRWNPGFERLLPRTLSVIYDKKFLNKYEL